MARRTRELSSRILLLSNLLFSIAAAQNGVTFLYPTAGLTINYLDTVNVTYESNFTSPLLYSFCTNSTGNGGIITGMPLPPFPIPHSPTRPC